MDSKDIINAEKKAEKINIINQKICL